MMFQIGFRYLPDSVTKPPFVLLAIIGKAGSGLYGRRLWRCVARALFDLL